MIDNDEILKQITKIRQELSLLSKEYIIVDDAISKIRARLNKIVRITKDREEEDKRDYYTSWSITGL